MDEIHDRIMSKIGADIILITSAALGIVGIYSIANKLEESDMEKAEESNNVYNHFNSLNEPPARRVFDQTVSTSHILKEKVFGGILFTSPNRGEKFFENSMTDCVPFCVSFPQIAIGGMYCFEPIGRAPVLEEEEWQSGEEERFDMQVFNVVHLVMSYKKIS